MRLGVRSKVFGVSLILIGLVTLVTGLLLETQLRGRLEQRIQDEFLRHARSIAALLETAAEQPSAAETDAIADRLGATTGARVTIIDSDGLVRGDSELTVEQAGGLDSHANRPEVQSALTLGQGVSRRYSTTLATEMLYVAVPLRHPDWGGAVVRVAAPLSEADEAIGQLRMMLVLVAGLALALAAVVSGVASHLLTRRLRELLSRVRKAQAGPTAPDGGAAAATDELGLLAGSFHQLAAQLDGAISELATERDRLETILEGMTDGVVALDGDQRVTLMNAEGLVLLDLDEPPVGSLLGASTDIPALDGLVARARDRSAPPVEFDSPAEPPRRVRARAAPLKVTGGTVLVMQDVTDMRRLENVRRDFVANVSHELRTPVSVIVANAETLLTGALEEPGGRAFVEAIDRNAQRLTALLADLLDLSRIEAGSYRLDTEPVDLSAAFARVVEAVSEVRDQRQVAVTVADGGAPQVLADPGGLDQILLNLLDNAVKYCAQGGQVELRAVAAGAAVRIEVRDDGPGIAAHHRERIFERFFRVDQGRSREAGGTGLGLAIVKHLTDAMNGSVGVEAGSAGGSVFWVELPRA